MPHVLDNRQRLHFAIIFQWVVVGASLVSIASEVAQYILLGRMGTGMEVSKAAMESNDWRQQVVSSTQIVLLLMSFIALVLWFFRAYGNLHRLHKAPAPGRDAGAAGWGWFVPVLNLWYPYQIMKEIWSLTQRYTEEGDFSSYKRDGSLISGWWMLRLLSFFASKGMRMPVAGSPAIAFQNFTMFGIGLDVLAIWYALTTLYLLRQVRPFEEALATRYGVDITSARSL